MFEYGCLTSVPVLSVVDCGLPFYLLTAQMPSNVESGDVLLRPQRGYLSR
jgi:hypothetical protein